MNYPLPCLLSLLISCHLMACGSGPLMARSGDGSVEFNWSTELYADHPLVGLIWSVKAQQFVSPSVLANALSGVPIVLVGERHDQPDHHRLQAWVIGQLKPGAAVGFEMLNEEQADGVSDATDIKSLSTRTKWSKNGWPDFKIYAPIFETVYRMGHIPYAIHPSRKRLRDAMMGPTSQKLQEQQSTQVIEAPGIEALKKAIEDGHCGYATPSLVNAMVLAQSFKDQWMTRKIMEVQTDGQRAIIAGNGHIRRDFGMPNHFKVQSVSIGILEVIKDKPKVEDYSVQNHDFVWFTPRLDDIDPCEKFKESLRKMRQKKQPQTP